MVEKLSRHIALWLIKSGILENDDIDLYIYAIQYLLLIINPTIIFTAYCIATHNITIGLIEVFSFLLIRKLWWLSLSVFYGMPDFFCHNTYCNCMAFLLH